MKIAVLKIRLYAPWVHSLKEKRMIIKSLLAKIRNKFQVSAAEVEEQDVLQNQSNPKQQHSAEYCCFYLPSFLFFPNLPLRFLPVKPCTQAAFQKVPGHFLLCGFIIV